jgi:hypothetical protein
MFGAARHLAVVAEERAQVSSSSPAHQTAVPANLQAGSAQVDESDRARRTPCLSAVVDGAGVGD